jgi:uncharacterized protein
MAPYLRSHADGVYLAIKVHPRASKNEIGPPIGAELKIKVTAPPVDAAANEAVLRLLSERLGCARKVLQLVRGQTSRHKTIFIQGASPAMIESKLSTGAEE